MKPLPKHPFDWRVLDSRHVIRDRWISLRADTCQMPSGTLVEPYYVLEYTDWTNVVAITPNLDVVLIREYRHGLGKTILELPSGSLNPKEDASPKESARRELLEETGYGGDELVELCHLSPNPGNHNNTVYSYLALNAGLRSDVKLDPTEQIEVVLMPLEQVKEMLLANQFVQAMHASALFYAFVKLGLFK